MKDSPTPLTSRRRKPGAPAREKSLRQKDWMEAGQQILLEEGISGMRLTKLVKKLNISTGSFYYHFVDMDDYLSKLAEYYSYEQIRHLAEEIAERYSDPVQQLKKHAQHSVEQGLFQLDIAMRVWATSDPNAAKASREGEEVVLKFITSAFQKLGFDRREAELRAMVLLSVNVTRLESISSSGNRGFREKVLNLLIQSKV
jgi:AcrR family transcriptional regulator